MNDHLLQAATERTAADGEQEDICVSEHSSFNVSEEQLLKQLEVAKLEEQVERSAHALHVRFLFEHAYCESLENCTSSA